MFKISILYEFSQPKRKLIFVSLLPQAFHVPVNQVNCSRCGNGRNSHIYIPPKEINNCYFFAMVGCVMLRVSNHLSLRIEMNTWKHMAQCDSLVSYCLTCM